MSKHPWVVSGVPPALGRLAFAAAIALTAMPAPSAHAQAGQPAVQPPPFFLNLCRQSKNFAAIQLCLDAADQDGRGNSVAAVALLKKAVAASPADGGFHLLLGYHLLGAGGAAPAEAEFRQAKALGIPQAAILAPLFRAMMAQHEEQQILKEFPEPAAKSAPEEAALIFRGRALALQSLGKIDDAAAQMDRSLSVRRDPVVLSERAVIALQQKNPALAGKLVDEALKLDPNNIAAMAAKLNLLERAGDGPETLALSDRMLKANPNNIDAHLARVRVLLKLNQDDRASSEVDAVLARSPNLLLARYYRAVLFSRAKNSTAAFQLIKTFPPYFTTAYPGLAMQMAQIAFDNGNEESGVNILGTALSAAPDLLDVRLRLVAYHLSHQNPQSALEVLAPVQNSPDPRVKEALARARQTIASQRPKF